MKRPASVLIAVAAVIAAAALLFGCAAPMPATPPSDGTATSAASAVESARPAVSLSPSLAPATPPSDGTATSAASAVESARPAVSPSPSHAPATPPSAGTATSTACAVESARPAVSPSPGLASQYEEVEFGADCGPTLRGRVWSEGSVGVVLAHGFSTDTGQDDWIAFAEYLAGLRYGVLTFDFRGFCDRDGCSERPLQVAENWRDVEAAVEYLRSRGSERIFIIGASMGGIAAFRAADEAELDLAGIVSLATPQYPSVYYFGVTAEDDVTPERLQRIAAPKLFIAGADDVQLRSLERLRPGVESVRFAEDARAMFEASPEPRQLEIVDSYLHSSSLVIGARPDVLEHTRQLIVAFIEEHA